MSTITHAGAEDAQEVLTLSLWLFSHRAAGRLWGHSSVGRVGERLPGECTSDGLATGNRVRERR